MEQYVGPKGSVSEGQRGAAALNLLLKSLVATQVIHLLVRRSPGKARARKGDGRRTAKRAVRQSLYSSSKVTLDLTK